MRLFATGDVHGDFDNKKIISFANLMKDELTPDDYLVVCGDFGILWDNGENDEYYKSLYNKFPCTILWVDGNHENFDLLYNYPVVSWMGGNIHIISQNILHLMRGEVFTLPINGKSSINFFTFGGAKSSDRGYNTGMNECWWPQELPTAEEIHNGKKNLKNCGNKVDFIFTHEAPQSVLKSNFRIKRDFDPKLNSFLEKIAKNVEFKAWFFGHHHVDAIENKFHILYNNIIELKL